MQQPEIFLHHYPASPFAEKVRLMLGYKKLAWKSVFQPSVMPKADLVALTGGYRRIPVMQIGADIICDTALMADVLERIKPTPTLYPDHLRGLVRVLAQWADTQLFTAAMAYNFQPAGAAHFFKAAPPEVMKAFGEDRKAMRGGAPRTAPGDATAAYKAYLRRISHMLAQDDDGDSATGEADASNQNFLLGPEPTLADFAIYHSLWFTQAQVTPLAGIFDTTPQIRPWLGRMTALGHGEPIRSSAIEAIAAARAAKPTDSVFDDANSHVDDHGIALGSRVSVTAESFGLEETVGTLVVSTRTRLTLERTDERAGTVRVHFPKVGYRLAAVS